MSIKTIITLTPNKVHLNFEITFERRKTKHGNRFYNSITKLSLLLAINIKVEELNITIII